ncbi:MAG: tRNA (adenosine(37)-N6)-threonylcarbamoyltransferase complex transferase subunit TsaD [Bacteroidia bacterium]
MNAKPVIILGIESSCDETAAAVLSDTNILANIIAGQEVHKNFGGVVPELASRAHQQNIVPVVDEALKKAGVKREDINAVAFTQGPGLLGSLLVGGSFAKAFALALNIPLIPVNHMQAHILAHFIGEGEKPSFPFLCLTVSGGHTQIVLVKDYLDMEVIGQTTDDAAGEAFDKAAKIMGLPYPGGPLVDKYAKLGNPLSYKFPEAKIPGYDFSFSGLKTAFMYFIRDNGLDNTCTTPEEFINKNLNDICASLQYTIVQTLMNKLRLATADLGITQVAIAGGVSANSGLRNALLAEQEKGNWKVYIPPFEYCTDNAAMIAITGHYKYLQGELAGQDTGTKARLYF